MIYREHSGAFGQNACSALGGGSGQNFRLSGVLVSVLFAALTNAALARDPVPTEPSIEEVQQALAGGRFTVRDLERHYERRITTIDRAGIRINSVLEINPD